MIRIVTDSATMYTQEEGQKLGIDVLPLCINIAELEGRDLQMDMDDLYSRIDRGQVPKSSQPPVGEVLDVFEKYEDDDIIDITMADGLSGTYQSACGVRSMAENQDNITVFNSKTLCGPQRYMVTKAKEMVDNGATKKEVLDYLSFASNSTESFLIPQDFEFLKRGGRLTPTAARFASVLKIKPVLILTETGKEIDKFALKKTMKHAFASIIHHMEHKGVDENYIIYISHACAPADAENAHLQFKMAFPNTQIVVSELSPAFVTHGGPRCIAVQYIKK